MQIIFGRATAPVIPETEPEEPKIKPGRSPIKEPAQPERPEIPDGDPDKPAKPGCNYIA